MKFGDFRRNFGQLDAATDEDEEGKEDEAAVAEEDYAWLSELAELASISSPSPLVEMVGSAVLVLTAALRRPDPAQVLAAAESIKKRAAKLSELPDGPIRDWYERNLRKGGGGMAEIIKGVLSKAQEVKDKDAREVSFSMPLKSLLQPFPDPRRCPPRGYR